MRAWLLISFADLYSLDSKKMASVLRVSASTRTPPGSIGERLVGLLAASASGEYEVLNSNPGKVVSSVNQGFLSCSPERRIVPDGKWYAAVCMVLNWRHVGML